MFMQDLVRFRPKLQRFLHVYAGFSALQAKLQRFLHVYAGFSALQAQVAEISACLCRI